MEKRYQKHKDFQKKLVNYFALLLFTVFASVTFISCGSDSATGMNDSNGPDDPQQEQGSNEVWMVGNTFNVSNLEVSEGTTVTWTNQSSVNHTVTSGSRNGDDAGDLFDSGNLAPGETFSHTFEDAGNYDYFCEIHPGMAAEVTVSEAN